MNRPFQNFWGSHTIGKGTRIGAYVEIGDDVQIGENCLIEAFVFICPCVRIESNCFIGPHVCFTNDNYPPSSKNDWQNTLVKRTASIGAGCVIKPGITIGEGAVIGCGSVVTKDVPEGEVWAGNPADKLVLASAMMARNLKRWR